MIELRGVSKTYQSGGAATSALREISLRIPKGAFATISGPSGSGKSTLLSVIGGIERADAGVIAVGGRVITSLDERALAEYRSRSVGFVFQAFHLIPNLTAENNVALPMHLAGMEDSGAKKRAGELLTSVGLEGLGHKLPHELSGGEQQRVAIARALSNRPQVLLADEPTGNLDSATGALVLDLLLRTRSDDTTLVVVTHDPELAARGSLRIEILDGRISRALDDQRGATHTA